MRQRTCWMTALACLTLSAAVEPASAAKRRTLYVQAGAPADGAGTKRSPLSSLAAVESASRPTDNIFVLPSEGTLDGGLELKPRQRLLGQGPTVTSLPEEQPAPAITNTSGSHLDGDAVRLADGVVVRNLRIRGPHRGGIYGLDITKATITRNDVAGHNTSCTPGFLIPPFKVPTILGGVGIPISNGLQNGWAGLLVDASKGRTKVSFNLNRVHDADCGDGIDVRAYGDSEMRVRIGGNDIRDLREGPDFQSILAIGLQSRDTARVDALLDDNRQAGLGNDEDVGTGPTGADTEGIFVNPTGPSSIRALITRNKYTHTPGRGAFSSNGLEFVSMGDGSRGLVTVRDSHFSGTPGDVIEQLALGTNGRLRMRLERVTAQNSTGFSGSGNGDTVVIPGNNGDCVLAASGGAGNVVDLAMRDVRATGCANNGLTFGSSVANGSGSSSELNLDVADSTITGNKGANLRVANVSGLDRLTAKVERTDLGDAGNANSNPANLLVQELGSTGSATIDLGGGPLGSEGGNCLDGGNLAALLFGYDVSARRTWWGTPGGPAPGRTAAVGSTLDTGAPLDVAPPGC